MQEALDAAGADTTPPSGLGPSDTTTTTNGATTDAQAETRTYALVGGTAALRFAPSGVSVLYATPKPGFTVETEPEHVNGFRVEFESDAHRSRVAGWWEGGPQDRTREVPG